jgi:hypothetical protein
LAGQYFSPNETLTFKMDCSSAQCTSTTVLGTVQTDNNGNIPSGATVNIPGGFTGPNVLGAVGSTGDFGETNFTEQ